MALEGASKDLRPSTPYEESIMLATTLAVRGSNAPREQLKAPLTYQEYRRTGTEARLALTYEENRPP